MPRRLPPSQPATQPASPPARQRPPCPMVPRPTTLGLLPRVPARRVPVPRYAARLQCSFPAVRHRALQAARPPAGRPLAESSHVSHASHVARDQTTAVGGDLRRGISCRRIHTPSYAPRTLQPSSLSLFLSLSLPWSLSLSFSLLGADQQCTDWGRLRRWDPATSGPPPPSPLSRNGS